MEYHVYCLLKISCFELSGKGNTVFFELKSWWKDDIYWLLKSPYFELFGGGKYGLFLAKDERWYLLSLFEISLIFQGFGNMVFRAMIYSIPKESKYICISVI